MTNSRRGDRRAQVALVCLLVTIGALVGYAMSSWTPRERIDDTYGKRHGIYGGRSVNGTAVLAGMFEKRGGRASSWDRLSPRLTRADTIVWAPDNSQVPESDQIAWFETWLHGGKNRTLIYIGRDYDAEVEYWQDVMPTVPAKQAQEAAKRLSDAKKDRASVRSGLSREAGAQWFKIRRDRPPRKITSFAGRWRFHIDSQKANILVGERIVIDSSQGGLVLLNGWSDEHQSDDPEPLVVAFEKGEVQRKNQLIVAANGSFLLNYPLINHEHRKLASLLIDHCHGLDDVVFLQSDKAGPPIVEEDPVLRQPGALEMSAVWPLSAIIPHVVALGIILCFALFPIFGRAKNLPQENRSDFAKHIDALGTLMARTKDYSYAQERVTHYQQRVKRDSSVSHSSPSVAKTTAAAENLSQPYQPRDTGATTLICRTRPCRRSSNRSPKPPSRPFATSTAFRSIIRQPASSRSTRLFWAILNEANQPPLLVPPCLVWAVMSGKSWSSNSAASGKNPAKRRSAVGRAPIWSSNFPATASGIQSARRSNY